MKKVFLTPVLFLLTVAAISQNQEYHIHGVRYQAIKKEKLATAESIRDIIPEYPAGWLNQQSSIELQATCNGKVVTSLITGEGLNEVQKSMMVFVDAGTDLVITLKGKYSTVQYSTKAIPETEAEYPGGPQQMTQYLQGVINKLSESNGPGALIPMVRVAFTVTEEGKITNASVSGTSINSETEQVLLEAIHQMPDWKPAKNSKGESVKQAFEFVAGNRGGGC